MDYTVTTPAIRDLTLSKDIRQILDDLDSGGYVIIRGATNIESVAQGSLDYVRREVVFNEASISHLSVLMSSHIFSRLSDLSSSLLGTTTFE